MGVNDRLVEYMYNSAKEALDGLTSIERDGVYAVSFFVYDEDDDPRLPTLTIGTNNEAQVQRMVPQASDAAEARWNFAFWMQNELRIVGGFRDPEGKTLVDEATRLVVGYLK